MNGLANKESGRSCDVNSAIEIYSKCLRLVVRAYSPHQPFWNNEYVANSTFELLVAQKRSANNTSRSQPRESLNIRELLRFPKLLVVNSLNKAPSDRLPDWNVIIGRFTTCHLDEVLGGMAWHRLAYGDVGL